MTFKDLLSNSSLNKFQEFVQDVEERDRKRYEEIVRESFERKRPYRFTSRQELIDYVKEGNKLYEEDDEGYMYYIPETNKVAHYSMQYDDTCDMPIGMGTTYKTWEDFVKWTAWMDDEKNLKHGTIPYWRKSY